MADNAKLTRKPAKKSLQSAIIAVAASSKFRKRQASEASTSSSQGLSAPESTADSSSYPSEVNKRAPSRPTTHSEESLTSYGGDNATYDSRGQSRLERPRRPLDAAASAEGVDTNVMGTVFEAVEPLVTSPGAMFPRPPSPTGPYDRTRTTPPPSRSATPNPTSSGGHWNQVRNYVSGSTNAVPPVPSVNVSQTAASAPPQRPQTPKPSRLAARLGFRQVVDQTREIAQDENTRFDVEVYQACASARFGELRQKADRDGTQGGYLPFMSTASLPLSVASTSNQPGKFGTTQSNEAIWRSPPSLRHLNQILIRYTSLSGPGGPINSLPYESEVLSVLLIPFTVDLGQRGNEERWLAVESFELAVKTWRASSPQRDIDRVLWCCKAALISTSPVRSRVLATLSNVLFSSTPLQGASPLALQNLLQGLLLLFHSFSKDPQTSRADTDVVRELINHVTGGACGEPDQQEIETEYEALWGLQDNEEAVRDQIVAEGVTRCMQNGSESLRRWVLHESVEAYWPSPSDSLSPLCRKIMARRLSAFLRASLSLLSADATEVPHRLSDLDSIVVIRLLHRALPELAHLPLPKHLNDGRALVIELAMQLLSVESHVQKQQIVEFICSWCKDDGWRQCLETGLRLFIERAGWTHLSKTLQDFIHEIPEEARKVTVSVIFTALETRLVADPAPHHLPGLTVLLRLLAQLYPQQFYKPLFSLAGASKDLTLVGQLGTVTALARHLPEFWIYDPEMMSVALMSSLGGATGEGSSEGLGRAIWGKPRIGQSLIVVELIRSVRQLIKEKKDKSSPPDASQSLAYRFVTGLEARLAILLDAKEKSTLVPLSQRTLLSCLLLEIRLFTRSLKPAPWLQKIVSWAAQSYIGARIDHESNPPSPHEGDPSPHVTEDAFDEVLSTVSKIQSIHIACWQTSPPNTRQRSTMMLSPTFDPRTSVLGSPDVPASHSEAIQEREELMASLSTSVASATLPLLVVVCALITQREHRILGPLVWSHFLDEEDPRTVAPACFLLTHCLEKAPKETTDLIEYDRRSSESNIRQATVRRLMTLFAWRSQLLSQTYLFDRARRRPFRMARQPIAFVAIDAGSGHYIHEQTEEDRKNLPGGSLPFELRKRLAEVGWEQDDQPTDTRLERVKAPISLFPASQLEHFSSSSENIAMSTTRSTESVRQLLRRKSSSSGHAGAKRRPVFVPALVSMFSTIVALAIDPSPLVASAAREATLLMLRDDPVMLCRPVMDMLSTDLTQVGSAVTTLNTFLHIHHRLPPSASHHIFSHLGGFLKHVSRDSDNPKALRAFSYTVPLLASLITQVSNLSIRDLRRAKFEIYVFPSGSLWFPPTSPPSTMFPQSMGPVINPFDDLPPQLVGVLMVRTAQNMLLLNMLKHKPHEVLAIRKSLTRFTLPGQDVWTDLDITSFLPRQSSSDANRGIVFRRASLAFSRSHLLLLAQVYRSMSRNFNGREELARLFDGINRILLAHGDDIGIVSHALTACMIAVTRFQRLVSSSGGFALFMPSVIKVYAEAEGHAGIRHAIQYASSRFYAIHQEAYVFQSLDLASNIVAKLELSEDQDWVAKNIYGLFSGLKSPLTHSTPDAAGIRGINKSEEREALIATTVSDETPRAGHQDSPRGEQLKKILVAGQYDDVVLNLDDFVRLLLTVIAHDPTVMRAQNFLALLRRMAPEFYNGSSSARGVLRDGINALGSALFSKAPRQRMHESIPGRPLQKSNVDVTSYGADDGVPSLYNPSAPCDQIIVRREYLNLIVAYSRMGGDLRHGTVRRALDIVKGLLKEPARPHPESEGTFLHELIDTSLSRLSVAPKQAIALLFDIAPVVKAFALTINCGDILDTITELIKRPELANDDSFVQLVVDQIAGPVLEACEDAASENTLLSLPMRPAVVHLVSHAAALGNADIISYIEKQSPSPGFLAGIVLPLCLTMKTSAELAAVKQWRHQDRLAKHELAFVRLLVYAMEACHANVETETGRSSPLPGINRRDSQRSKHSSLSASRTPLATLTLVLQIIKVIVFRAADDLSRGLTGIWARLATFLKHLLDDGDARFALASSSSPAPSPWQSPILSPRPHSPSSDTHVPSSPAGSAPRVVDFITWSLLEYLCCAPSPLTLQMRLWMQEKAHYLDAELQTREASTPLAGHGSRRLSSSVFARPRGSSTSPDALRASHGLPSITSELNLSASSSTDFAAYSRFSSRGSLQPSRSGLRIVHLGPTKDHHQMFHPMERSSSQDSNLKNLARTSHVGLPSLVKSTYNRIRLVQTCMGYDRLLPMEGQGGFPGSIDLKAWTRTSTLAGIVAEVKELMDEFPENFYENVGGDFVDVPYGAGFGSVQSSPVKGLHA